MEVPWVDHFTGSWNPTTRQREASREGEPFDDSNLRRNHTQTVFDYDLPGGRLLYQKNRYDPVNQSADIADKKFLPSRPVDLDQYDRERNIGASVIGPGERRIIFNWQAVIDAGQGSIVLLTEGEKNAVYLQDAGLLATSVISNALDGRVRGSPDGIRCHHTRGLGRGWSQAVGQVQGGNL